MSDITVLGFDYGERRIGIAVGQTITQTARPLTTVVNPKGKINWADIEQQIRDWSPDKLLVGLPLRMDGSEQPIAKQARKFAANLDQRFEQPVELVDERLSSKTAEETFVAQRHAGLQKRKSKAVIDSMAASVIVERWLSGGFSIIA